MPEPTSLVDYYSRRAPEYDAIWEREDPERRAEQETMASTIQNVARNRSVLEVACGTGYWTQYAVEFARRVVGVDASEAMLQRARQRIGPGKNVKLTHGDAFQLDGLDGDFDAGVSAFWLSHVPRARVREFLAGFHRRLSPGSIVFLADNVDVPGVGGDRVTNAGGEDTFNRRRLSDGSEYIVLKNYYRRSDLEGLFQEWRSHLEVHVGQCFWWVRYQLP